MIDSLSCFPSEILAIFIFYLDGYDLSSFILTGSVACLSKLRKQELCLNTHPRSCFENVVSAVLMTKEYGGNLYNYYRVKNIVRYLPFSNFLPNTLRKLIVCCTGILPVGYFMQCAKPDELEVQCKLVGKYPSSLKKLRANCTWHIVDYSLIFEMGMDLRELFLTPAEISDTIPRDFRVFPNLEVLRYRGPISVDTLPKTLVKFMGNIHDEEILDCKLFPNLVHVEYGRIKISEKLEYVNCSYCDFIPKNAQYFTNYVYWYPEHKILKLKQKIILPSWLVNIAEDVKILKIMRFDPSIKNVLEILPNCEIIHYTGDKVNITNRIILPFMPSLSYVFGKTFVSHENRLEHVTYL